MREIPEGNESLEKKLIKTPEKKIETFDDLKTSDKSGQIETFNDIRKQGTDNSINTFDDIRSPKDTSDKTTRLEEKGATVKDTPELLDQQRINQATEAIKKNEWMQPKKWQTLSNDEKRIALEHSGKALRDAYKSPDPPLVTKNMGDPGLQGEYGDGYSSDSSDRSNPENYVGSDYGIRMNENGIDYEKNKQLFGDDPHAALETYSHEFRHSYQQEQAHAYDKGFKTDDSMKAKEWADNIKDYKQPPDSALANTDPEKYFREYEAYRNQPIEKDAREFGSRISSDVYKETYGGNNGRFF